MKNPRWRSFQWLSAFCKAVKNQKENLKLHTYLQLHDVGGNFAISSQFGELKITSMSPFSRVDLLFICPSVKERRFFHFCQNCHR